MFTSYRMYDLREVEVIADKRRQLRANDAPASFEGASVRVGGADRTRASRSHLRTVLAVLRSVIVSAAQPLRHVPGGI